VDPGSISTTASASKREIVPSTTAVAVVSSLFSATTRARTGALDSADFAVFPGAWFPLPAIGLPLP
jgi:hypothetical protein